MISELITILENHTDPIRAKKMKSYMRNQFDFYGFPAHERRIISKDFVKSFKVKEIGEIMSTVQVLWNEPKRDCQYIGMDLLDKNMMKFRKEDLPFLQNLITNKSWWDTVDWLASHAVGSFILKYQSEKYNLINKWSNSNNIWLIRACIIHQLFYKKNTDKDLMAALILKHIDTKEFFINKASGWALRQYSKTNPSWVKDFITTNVDILSNLTKSEGLKWIKRNTN